MAQSVSAIDDAIAHLDSILGRLTNSEPAAAPAAAPAAPVPAVTKAAVISGDPIQSADEVVDVKPKQREEKPIPDILKGRNLKLPGAKAATSAAVASGNEQNDNFDKALMQVAVVQSVENHPNSEKLYVCKIDVGGGTIKQVVAGLKKFVTVEELQGRLVCVILNLKTAKLAGQVSEAMILAGSVATAEGSEIVKVLEPPSESAPGDRIFQEGGSPSASPAKQLSSKIWEKIVPLLKVEGGLAVFDSKPLVTSSGSIKVPGLPDGAGIH
jgi:aminoacyl tRNA synthase complex-interacting multifunctional protein 1